MLSAPQAVAGYAEDKISSGKEPPPEGSATAQMANYNWQRLLSDTTITLGCNNVFGHDPPTAIGLEKYPGFLYDSTGRFVYLSARKILVWQRASFGPRFRNLKSNASADCYSQSDKSWMCARVISVAQLIHHQSFG